MSVELINKVRVHGQIADEGMAVGEGKSFLFTLLADQAAKIFKAIGAGFKRLRAGSIDGSSRVLLDQSAQAHNGTQRFGSAPLKGALSPLTALLTYDRCSADPIANTN
jgi:hypothetical protein